MLQAILWDVDGTLAETERDAHRVAFNQAFEAFGLPWHWSVERYGELLRITGGRERILHDMAGRADAPALAGDDHGRARLLVDSGWSERRIAVELGVSRHSVRRALGRAGRGVTP